MSGTPQPGRMHQLVADYADAFSAKDRAAWLSLFADDVEVIEPADSMPRRGKAVVAGVFDAVYASETLDIALKPLHVIVNGNEAAIHMQVRVSDAGKPPTISSVIEIFTVSEAGRITRLRTYLDTGAASGTNNPIIGE